MKPLCHEEDYFPWDTQPDLTCTYINANTPTQWKCIARLERQGWITECIWQTQWHAWNKHNTWLCHTGFSDNETNKHGWRYCLLWATIRCLLLERPATQPVSVSLYSILDPALIASASTSAQSDGPCRPSNLYPEVYCPATGFWDSRGVRRGSRRRGGEVFRQQQWQETSRNVPGSVHRPRLP